MDQGSEERGQRSPVGASGAADLAAQVAVAFAAEPGAPGAAQRLLEPVVAAFAEWGSLHLVRDDGTLRRVAVHHVDPDMVPVAERLMRTPALDASRLPEVMAPADGDRARVHRQSAEDIQALAPSPVVQELWERLGSTTGVLVPLVSEGRTVGVLALGSSRPEHFSDDDVTALERVVGESFRLTGTARLARRAEAEQGERVRVRVLLDSLLDLAPIATIIVDPQRRVLHHNRALDALTTAGAFGPDEGPPSETALVPVERLMPKVGTELKELAARALAAEAAVDPIEIRSGNPGRRLYWQASAFPIFRADGGLFGAGLIFVDVTDERVASQRQEESRARLELSLEAGGMGTWDWDLSTGRVEWSPGMFRITGVAPEDFEGTGEAVRACVAEVDRNDYEQVLVAAAREATDYKDEFRITRPDGEERWVENRGRVLVSRRGVPLRMIGVSTDVTERHVVEDVRLGLLDREHQARLAAEKSRERLALLAEVSGVLASTLDLQEVYDDLAERLVPRLADWCTLDALDDDGEMRETAVVHVDPRHTDLVRRMRAVRREAGGDGIWSVRRAMRTGRSERVEDITDEDLQAVAVDLEHLELLRTLAPRSAMVAPLVARGRVLGGISLVTTGPRSYDGDDQALLESIANRAATAVDTAMLFDSRTEVARALQQTLLPPALPEIPGIDVWADYRVAEGGIEIGGDFYDVFEATDGWNVVLGDVCGKGPAAAAVTGLFRHTLRAISQQVTADGGPAAVLAATNDAILDQIDDTRFATAVLVSLRPGRGRATARVACGGHPRPVLVRVDGSVERIDATGTLLGVLPDPQFQEVELEMGPGDSLVLYTDGVTEARDGPEQFGESRLMAALEGAKGMRSARDVCRHLVAAVDAFRDPDSAADDIAVVTIRVPSLHDA